MVLSAQVKSPTSPSEGMGSWSGGETCELTRLEKKMSDVTIFTFVGGDRRGGRGEVLYRSQ